MTLCLIGWQSKKTLNLDGFYEILKRMSDINNEFMERYQRLWDSDPTSRVFAPLAEGYRRGGNLQKALQICRQGLNLHPTFAGGWYQLAKIYLDRQETEKATEALKKTISLAPENIQAHNLLADLYLTLRQPKDALKSFKMVLLLNPHDVRAQKTIERLESLTADEYSPETFQIGTPSALENNPETNATNDERLTETNMEDSPTSSQKKENRALEQTVTLIDALLVRNEFTKAKAILMRSIGKFGRIPELESRLSVIAQQREKSFEDESPEIIQPVPPRPKRIRQLKINKLEKILKALNQRELSEG